MAHAPAPRRADPVWAVLRGNWRRAGQGCPTVPVPHYAQQGSSTPSPPMVASRGHRADRRPCCAARPMRVDRRAAFTNRILRMRIVCVGLGRDSICTASHLALLGQLRIVLHKFANAIAWYGSQLALCFYLQSRHSIVATAFRSACPGALNSTPTSCRELTSVPARAGLSAHVRSAGEPLLARLAVARMGQNPEPWCYASSDG